MISFSVSWKMKNVWFSTFFLVRVIWMRIVYHVRISSCRSDLNFAKLWKYIILQNYKLSSFQMLFILFFNKKNIFCFISYLYKKKLCPCKISIFIEMTLSIHSEYDCLFLENIYICVCPYAVQYFGCSKLNSNAHNEAL